MTPQHHIIKEASDSISRLLQDEFKKSGYKRVHIVEEAPKQDAVEGKLPAVSCYLYQLSPDYEGLNSNMRQELVKVKSGDQVREFARPARTWIRLDYLISCWAQTPEDEQLLMGLIIRTLLDNVVIGGENLRGESFRFEEDVYELPLQLSSRLDEGTLARFWGSLQQPVRPAIQLWTLVPIIPESMQPITRVRTKTISYRDLNQPNAPGETGPDNNFLTRKDLTLGSGGKR
jgi:hypothetical protein